MRIRYWTIALSPNPTRIDQYGVGVVAENTTTNAFDFRLVKASALPAQGQVMNDSSITDSLLENFQATLQEFQRIEVIEHQPALELGKSFSIGSHMDFISRHWNSAISIHPARFMATELPLEKATEHLFEMFILPQNTTTKRNNLLRTLREKVVSDYEAFEAIKVSLVPKAKMKLAFGPLDGKSDLAVIKDNQAFELNTAFNFNGSQPHQLAERAQAWTLHIQSLRDKGGKLTYNGKEIYLDKHTPVTAVVTPPVTEQQQEAHYQATALWSDLQITNVSEDSIYDHAVKLAERLAA
ncbi:MAG: hypothetical protein Q4A82_07415 [Corynebacterium sp.]|nr:hypothetical protein [Corynebacterium sp.]